MTRSRTDHSTPMLSVYDGQVCVGFVLARGLREYEAFDAGEQSLGVFATRDAAVNKLTNESKQT
jgi:hypothetical protein